MLGPLCCMSGIILHHGGVPAQCIRFAENEFVAQLPLILHHEADGLAGFDFNAIRRKTHGIAHGHGNRSRLYLAPIARLANGARALLSSADAHVSLRAP